MTQAVNTRRDWLPGAPPLPRQPGEVPGQNRILRYRLGCRVEFRQLHFSVRLVNAVMTVAADVDTHGQGFPTVPTAIVRASM